MSRFEIHTSRIADGVHQYSFEATGEDLELPPAFRAGISVTAALDRRGRQFFVSGAAATRGTFTCDRCLAPFEMDIEGTFSVLFVPEGVSAPQDDAEDEVRTIPSDTMVIVLDEDVRQSVNLAVPAKLLCKEDCKGLCPRCGTNRNEKGCTCEVTTTDPRWEPLRKLSRS